jgi:hypothetical protein
MKYLRHILITALFFLSARAEGLDPATQAKVDARIKEITSWASDPVIVKAVVDQNASMPAAYSAMTQEKWKALSVLDPFVRGFTKNTAGAFLKSKKADWVLEAFLSSSSGVKVALLSKTSNWSHAGKPKHEDPMKGKTWQGVIEMDESTGLQQLQIAVPVLSEGKAVGSLVVGLSLSKI